MNQETGWRAALEPRLMRGVAGLFERLDFDAGRYCGAWLGLTLYGALGRRRNIASENVRLALGVSRARANQIARRSCVNFGMTFAEFLHARVAGRSEVRRQCDIVGLQHIDDGFARGRGVVLLTAHVGNWELMGARAAQEFPLTVVARPTSNAGVQQVIDACRAAQNVRVISKYENGRASLRVLKSNQALGILPDQHAGREGALLPMFGHPTRIWTALARLALISGARVVPAFGVRRRPFLRDGRIQAQVFPGWNLENAGDKDAGILEGTRRVVWELERVVRQNPEQWLWLHRRWREADGARLPQ